VLRTRRDLGYWLRPIDRVLGRFYNRLTTAVVANCEACRRAVIAQERTSPDAVAVIENGIDLAPFAAIPAPAPDGNGHCRTVGMVANLRPVKAPEVFVRAAAIVARRVPGVVFQIAGGGDLNGVRRLADECGLGNRLRLRGAVDDIPAFVGRLDVAVLTSHSEGLSNAMLEYMAAARPIVATAVGGNVELIENGVHGLLVPPANPEAVAGAIERLLADHALAAALGIAARQRVAEHFSPAAMVERYQQLYARLMEPRAVMLHAKPGRKRTARTSEIHAHSGSG
jgi:L-malate glycosyltransferase